MIWNSIGIMSAIDALILAMVAAVLYVFARHWRRLTELGAAYGLLAVATGLGVTGAFYAADLFTMQALPRLIPRADAMQIMATLHTNYRWLFTLAGIGATSVGFLTIIKRTRETANRLEKSLNAYRESEVRRQLFMDSATEHFTLFDADLNLIDVNAHSLEAHGWVRAEVIGRRLADLFPDAESSGRLQKYRRVIETGEPIELEAGAGLEQGRKGQAVLRIFKAGDGLGVCSVDITERKKAESAIRKSEEALRLFQNSARDDFALYDRDLRLLSANARALVHMERTLDDAIGKPLLELVPHLSDTERFQHYQRIAHAGGTYDCEFEFTASDGKVGHRAISAFPAGEGVGIITRDITEQKRAEAALHDSEELRRRFMDSARATFALFDSDLNFLDLNKAGLDRFGLTSEDVIGKNLAQLSPDAFEKGRFDSYFEVMRTGKAIHLEALQHESRDGERRTMDVRAFPVGDGLGVIADDVTDKARAETALRESEELRRQFMDSAGAAFSLFDSELNFLDINTAGLTRFGFNKKDVVGKNLADISKNAVSSGRYARYLDIIRTGEPIRFEATSPTTREGKHRIMDMRVFPVADGLGVISDDITERKAAEAGLRKSEELRRLFMDSADATFVLFDSEMNIVEVNRAGLERFGFRREDLIGRNLAEVAPGSLQSGAYDRYLQLLSTGESFRDEAVHSVKDGHERIMDTLAFPVGDGLGLIAEDVTERRAAEAARRDSEETLHVFFESAKDNFALLDRDMKLLHANSSAVSALGHTRETAVGKHLLEIAPQLAGSERYAAYERVIETGEPYEGEAILTPPNGSQRINAVSAFRAGEGIGIIVRDITERKEAEAALRQSEERLNAFFADAPAGLVIFDRDLHFVRINNELAKTNGMPPAEHIGKTLRDVIPRAARQLEPLYRNVIETGRSAPNIELDVASPTDSNAVVSWLASLFPILGADGRPDGVGAITLDVTDQKRAERDLALMNQHLEELVLEQTQELRTAQEELLNSERLAAVGNVTATVAHELRNPLGTIRTSVFSLRAKVAGSGEGTTEILHRIDRNITRCDRIIAELLDYSAKKEPQFDTLNLNECLATWLEDYEASEGVRIRLSIPDVEARVRMDLDRIHQVIVNILDNALQANAEESARRDTEIAVRTRAEGGQFILEVADDGPGIPEDLLPRIFEPLFSTKAFGVGLGLPLVKKIVDQHGGHVEVESEIGNGTCFRISLPLSTSNEAAA